MEEDEHDGIDLTFNLEFQKVDQSAFQQELYHGLADFGVKKTSLAVVDLALREGSTIAELRGPHFAVQEIRGKDLSTLQVMGESARVNPYPSLDKESARVPLASQPVQPIMMEPMDMQASSAPQQAPTTATTNDEGRRRLRRR